MFQTTNQIKTVGSVCNFGKFEVGQFDLSARHPLENDLKPKLPFQGFRVSTPDNKN
jgi:hypothetical protein